MSPIIPHENPVILRSVQLSINLSPLRLVVKRSPRMRKIGIRTPYRDRPKSLKQVVTGPLSNARQQI